jgi:hypothetical protein
VSAGRVESHCSQLSTEHQGKALYLLPSSTFQQVVFSSCCCRFGVGYWSPSLRYLNEVCPEAQSVSIV